MIRSNQATLAAIVPKPLFTPRVTSGDASAWWGNVATQPITVATSTLTTNSTAVMASSQGRARWRAALLASVGAGPGRRSASKARPVQARI